MTFSKKRWVRFVFVFSQILPLLGQEVEQLAPLIVSGNPERADLGEGSQTATRMGVPVSELPLRVETVSSDDLEEQQVLDLSEALRNLSGTEALVGGVGQANQITIRGFNSFIYEDGFRLGNSNNNGVGALSLPIDPAAIERIEVLKGPAATLYGRGLSGGVINVIRKKPQDAFGGSFIALGGSYDRYRNSLDLTGPLREDGSLNYRFIGSAERRKSFRDFVEEEDFSIYPSVEWEISERSSLLVSGEYRWNETVPDRGVFFLPNVQPGGDISPSLAPIASRSTFFGDPANTSETTQSGMTVDFRSEVSEVWTTRLALGARFFREQGSETFGDQIDDSGENLIRFHEVVDATREDFLIQFDNTFEFTHGFFGREIDHTLLLAVEWQRNRSQPGVDRAGVDQVNLRNGSITTDVTLSGSTFPVTALQQSTNFDLVGTDMGIGLQDLIEVTDRWNVFLGFRYERSELDFALDPFPISDRVMRDEFLLRTGVLYQHSDDLSFFVNYGEGYAPSLVVSPVASAFEAQVSSQVELGARLSLLEDRLRFNTAAFTIRNDNVLAAVGRDALGNVTPGILDEEVDGVEFDLDYRLSDYWTMMGNYSFLDSRVRGAGLIDSNEKGGVPRHSANLWASYHLNGHENRGLSLSLGAEYRSRVFSSAENVLELPSVFLLNAAVRYRAEDWTANLTFHNLTNREYFIPNSSVEIGDSNTAISALPGAPFEVRTSLSYEF